MHFHLTGEAFSLLQQTHAERPFQTKLDRPEKPGYWYTSGRRTPSPACLLRVNLRHSQPCPECLLLICASWCQGGFVMWCILGAACLESLLSCAGPAMRSVARAMIASTYIRQLRSGLPQCCMHGLSLVRDGANLGDGTLAKQTSSHTSDPPTHPGAR